jgi:hypothetical protein
MSQQNFKNHTRLHPFYHYFIQPLALFGLIYSGIRLANADAENHLNAFLIFLAYMLIFCSIALVRLYALKVQDRVIRSEENFRYFILTGKQLDSRLTTRQIIALRFASDEEMPLLAKRAIDEQLKEKEIKKSIVNWRADHRRV